MPSFTTINGFQKPAQSDFPNIETAVHPLADAADAKVCPRFSTLSIRNSRIPSPIEGMMCYVTETKEHYIFHQGTWMSAWPRLIRPTSDKTLATANPDQQVATFFVEKFTLYLVWGFLNYSVNSTDDARVQWTSLPSGTVGFWRMWDLNDDQAYTIVNLGVFIPGVDAGEFKQIHNCYIKTGGNSGTATLSIGKFTDVGADGTLFRDGTCVFVQKIAEF